MFDRLRATKHAPQALAFFIEQDGPPRVVVAHLDTAPSAFFHTNLLGGQIFARHAYAVNSPSGLKSWRCPLRWTRGFPPNYALVERKAAFSFNAKPGQSVCSWHSASFRGGAESTRARRTWPDLLLARPGRD